MATTTRVLSKIKDPRGLAAAGLRRLVPNSPRYGFPWVHRPDGSVTFHERGFVAAASPSALLARHNYETQRIRQELAGSAFARSLEIGCGFGRLTMTFAEHSKHHVAVDINGDALAAARVSYPQCTFEQTSPSGLPFPDDHFELVCSWTVIQHVRPEKIEAMCDDLLRVLTPGGTLLICEETRNPDGPSRHTWHRRVQEYERLLSPLALDHHSYITELDRMPGMQSPGEVMLFRGSAT